MQACRKVTLNQEFWTVKQAANVLKIPEERARRLVYSLRRLGYVEVVPQQRLGTWRNTMAGNALANATAAPPISRPDADRQLKEFLIRVGIVNGDKSWLYRVGKVVLFGSYLNNQEWLATSIWRSDWKPVWVSSAKGISHWHISANFPALWVPACSLR